MSCTDLYRILAGNQWRTSGIVAAQSPGRADLAIKDGSDRYVHTCFKPYDRPLGVDTGSLGGRSHDLS